MDEETLFNLLKGANLQRPQSVGVMHMVPITRDESPEEIGLPSELRFGTSEYGTVQVQNNGDRYGILPLDSAIVTEYAAQDHAVPEMVVVKPHGRAVVRSARCIESTTGGLIQATGDQSLFIMPYPLRGTAAKNRGESGYNLLWPPIQRFNEVMQVRQGRAHLVDYFKAYAPQMDSFVAQFERLPNQIGALIFVNSALVGVELAPYPAYWAELWNPLIRTCYGSLALFLYRLGVTVQENLFVRPLVADSAVTFLEMYQDTLRSEGAALDAVMHSLTVETLQARRIPADLHYRVTRLDSGYFTGFSVHAEAQLSYLSIVGTEAYMDLLISTNSGKTFSG